MVEGATKGMNHLVGNSFQVTGGRFIAAPPPPKQRGLENPSCQECRERGVWNGPWGWAVHCCVCSAGKAPALAGSLQQPIATEAAGPAEMQLMENMAGCGAHGRGTGLQPRSNQPFHLSPQIPLESGQILLPTRFVQDALVCLQSPAL